MGLCGVVAQAMYARVSKCKNGKIKGEKVFEEENNTC
jgi:hypothetical protein